MNVLFSSVLIQREESFQQKYINIYKSSGVSYQKNSKQRQNYQRSSQSLFLILDTVEGKRLRWYMLAHPKVAKAIVIQDMMPLIRILTYLSLNPQKLTPCSIYRKDSVWVC